MLSPQPFSFAFLYCLPSAFLDDSETEHVNARWRLPRYQDLERNAAASRRSVDVTVPGAICYQEIVQEGNGANAANGSNSSASPGLRLLTAATLKTAASEAIRAGEAVPTINAGIGWGTSFPSGSDSDDSDDSSESITSASGTSLSSDAAARYQRYDNDSSTNYDIESGNHYGSTATEARVSGAAGCCNDASANVVPFIRKVLSIVCCPVRVSAKACGKAAKCIERAVDVDAHELQQPVQVA